MLRCAEPHAALSSAGPKYAGEVQVSTPESEQTRNESSDRERVEELAFECLESADPARHLEELARQHPELAPRLRRAFGQLERQGLLQAPPAPSLDEIPDRLGKFRLQRRLGAGGMGVVYLAEDEELGRNVALKLIRPEQMFFPGARERFQREIEAIARLQHPGIVPVFEVGRHDGIPYFAMEHVVGCSLADVIHDLQESQAPPESRMLLEAVARRAGVEGSDATETKTRLADKDWVQACIALVSQVAGAVHHAHELRVLHRDIKPSNVLITVDGRARVVDFGLAWTDQAEQRLTQTSSQLGSLPYLPPECVSGRLPDPSRRIDVYALGVMLYELLTLKSPYLAETPEETRRRILEARPVPPRRLERRVPRDVETVCLKAMDPDPAERYATAAELLADLEHIRDHEPITARRPGLALRARRWTQRHPTLTATLAVALVLMTVGFFAFGVSQRSARLEADRLAALAQQERYGALLLAANVELGKGIRTSVARRMLANCRAEHRGWEWRYLEFASDESTTAVSGIGASIECVAWSPDGERFVTTSQDGALGFWSADGRSIGSIEGVKGAELGRVAFRPLTKGREIVTGSVLGRLTARDGRSGKVLADFSTVDPETGVDRRLRGQVVALAFTPDGRRLFTTSSDGRVVAWDAQRRTWLAELGKHGLSAHSLDVSRDGKLVASGGYDGTIHIYDASTLQKDKTLRLQPVGWRGMPRFVMDLQFSADAKKLFVADVGPLKFFDLAAGKTQPQVLEPGLRHTMALALSPDGSRLAAIIGQRALHVFDLGARTGRVQRVQRLLGHEGLVTSVEFHPDGKRLVSGGSEPVARLWNVGYAAEGHFRPSRRLVRAVAALNEDTSLTVDSRGSLWRTQIASGESTQLARGGGKKQIVGLVTIGQGVWSIEAGGRARLWNASDTQAKAELETTSGVTAAAGCGDDRLAIASEGELSIFDVTSGKRLRSWRAHDGHVTCVAADSIGQSLWTASVDGSLRHWDPRTGALVRELERHPAWISCLVVAPSGEWIASGCADTSVRIFEARIGSLRHTLLGHGRAPLALAVTPSNDRLVSSGGYDNELRIWDPETGRPLLSLVIRPATTSLAFSSTGELLLCGTSLGEVKWLRARPGGARRIQVSRLGGGLDTITSRPDRVGDHR